MEPALNDATHPRELPRPEDEEAFFLVMRRREALRDEPEPDVRSLDRNWSA